MKRVASSGGANRIAKKVDVTDKKIASVVTQIDHEEIGGTPAPGHGGIETWWLILERCVGGEVVSVGKKSVIHSTPSHPTTPPMHRCRR